MKKLLLMLFCVAGVVFAADNMNISNMKGMSNECKAMMKSHDMKKWMMELV